MEKSVELTQNISESHVEDSAWDEYVEKHAGTKGYAHFDARCDIADVNVQNYILNPYKVARHSFWPFIHYVMSFTKAKKIENQVVTKDKNREIHYAAHMDSCIFNRYAFLLNQKYNEYMLMNGLNEVAIAYRNNLKKPPCYFAAKAFKVIRDMQHCLVFIGDFTEFFDRINHRYLKKQLRALLNVKELPKDYYAVFKNVTRYSSCELEDILKINNVRFRSELAIKNFNRKYKAINNKQFISLQGKIKKNDKNIGVPQGAAISDVFANVYMMDFDKDMNEYVKSQGGQYMRYSDDTIIILPLSEDKTIQVHETAIHEILRKYENVVDLQPEKTKKFEYHNGSIQPINSSDPLFIDYLGLRLTRDYIGLRPRCLTKYYYRMHRKAFRIRAKKMRVHFSHQKNSYKQIYEIYGKGKRNLLKSIENKDEKQNKADKKVEKPKSTFIGYIEMVDKVLKDMFKDNIGLERDYETRVLLHNGWKKKIRKAITIKSPENKI